MSDVEPPETMSIPLSEKNHNNKVYRLVILQQPDRVRSAGFGQKDRRPVDPPPILQLSRQVSDNHWEPVIDATDILFMVAQCDLYSEDGITSCNLVYNPSRLPEALHAAGPSSGYKSAMSVRPLHEPTPLRNLTGASIANACQLLDTDNKPGVFFIFPDISVRTEGRFTLNFVLIDLSDGEPSTMSTHIKCQVRSNPFTVYSPKTFPGMCESTPLSIAFAKQGIKIAVRRGSRFSRNVIQHYSSLP
ncbi:velvet factor [Umbelopsis sp. AD052]|nr:velvet factor [Umbelopsis sp. AD052]